SSLKRQGGTYLTGSIQRPIERKREVGAIQGIQPLSCICKPDSCHACLGLSRTAVLLTRISYEYLKPVTLTITADVNLAFTRNARYAMFDCVLYQRLEDFRRYLSLQNVIINRHSNAQPWTDSNLLNGQVFLNDSNLLRKANQRRGIRYE